MDLGALAMELARDVGGAERADLLFRRGRRNAFEQKYDDAFADFRLAEELAEKEGGRAKEIFAARAKLLVQITELDQFAYERQCKELAGYQVGPDKERVDPSRLLSVIDQAKKSLDVITGA